MKPSVLALSLPSHWLCFCETGLLGVLDDFVFAQVLEVQFKSSLAVEQQGLLDQKMISLISSAFRWNRYLTLTPILARESPFFPSACFGCVCLQDAISAFHLVHSSMIKQAELIDRGLED